MNLFTLAITLDNTTNKLDKTGQNTAVDHTHNSLDIHISVDHSSNNMSYLKQIDSNSRNFSYRSNQHDPDLPF